MADVQPIAPKNGYTSVSNLFFVVLETFNARGACGRGADVDGEPGGGQLLERLTAYTGLSEHMLAIVLGYLRLKSGLGRWRRHMGELQLIEQVTWSWCLQGKLAWTHQRSEPDIVNVLIARGASGVGYGSVRDGLRVGRAGCWRRRLSESSGDDGWRCRLRLGLELA